MLLILEVPKLVRRLPVLMSLDCLRVRECCNRVSVQTRKIRTLGNNVHLRSAACCPRKSGISNRTRQRAAMALGLEGDPKSVAYVRHRPRKRTVNHYPSLPHHPHLSHTPSVPYDTLPQDSCGKSMIRQLSGGFPSERLAPHTHDISDNIVVALLGL
ncbi:hypothetical protein K461DRAFT_161222 [Myriangium duriaei CBS 260.36]|uniref:Uncharacterized protein n=1 Tax=Myriangium duriaei CBS 260.36 TaxID=1168546 RepID=A0A9P4J261_9PEZI|nr:hypothetical protein K461DRAFT_161222 [Myriangium duriaei CBS 260.36]